MKESSTQKVQEILRRQAALEQRRTHFEDTWEDIAEFIIPRRERFRTTQHIKGERYGESIYDSTGVQSAQIATDGTQGHMVSPSFRWLALIMRDYEDDHEVRDWLQEVAELLYLALNPTNFYEAMNEFIMDGWTIGTAAMYVEEDVQRGLPTFRTLHPREVYIAEDSRGKVDTLHRRFYLTARQAIQLFGDYDERVVRMAERTPDQEIEFVHAVFPRAERDSYAKDAENMPWASCYIDKGRSLLVREGGYQVFPYAVWRFRKNSDEEYGRSPGWDALRPVKLVNAMVESTLKMVQMSASPPRFIPEQYKNAWRFIPGAINLQKRPEDGPSPYFENQQLPNVMEMIQWVREDIKSHFWVDFWQMMNMNSDRAKTATEVIEMQNEKLAILTSTIGRFDNEALNPIIDNVFHIEMQGGRLPQPPQILLERGGRIEVDYVGPLNLAVRRLKSQGTQQALMQVLQLAQADPTVLMRYDMDEAVKQIAQSYGMDQDVIRTDEQVAEIMQRQQEAQQQAMAAQQQAEVTKKVDPNQPMQKGSLISEVMGR